MNDDELESALRRLRPRGVSREFRERLQRSEPVVAARTEGPSLPWLQVFMRVAFAAVTIGALLLVLLPEPRPIESRPVEVPIPVETSDSIPLAFEPVETNRVILSSQPIGTMTGPDNTPLELRRVRWLDFSRSQSPAGDQLVIGYESEQIIPVALTVH